MISVTTVLAQPGWGDHMWGGGWWWMGLSMMLFWAVVVGLVVWLVVSLVRSRDGGTDRGPGSAPDRARQILAERYARGEIDTDEYEERLQALR